VDFELNDKQRALQQDVIEFCERECPPEFESELDRTGEFPADLYKKMGTAGLLGVPFVVEEDGADIVEIEGGKITRNEVFFDRTALLEAMS